VSARRFAGLVFVGTVLMQAAWIAVLPPFRGIDEFDHAFRAAAVAHGEWEAGDWAAFGRGRLVTVPAALADAANAQCADLTYVGRDNCLPVKTLPDGMVQIASSAGGYNPVYYWLIGTVGRPFSGAGSLYAMRIATALLAAGFIALAAWCLARVRASMWTRSALVLALTPVAFYTTILAAPNGLEMVAGLALWCAMLALPTADTPALESRLLWVAGVSALLLGGLRPLGPGFLVVIVGITTLLSPRLMWGVVRRHRRSVAVIGLLAIAAAVAQMMWKAHEAARFGPFPGVDFEPPMRPALMVLWQLQVIAAFPFRDQPAPAMVYALFTAVLLAFLGVALRRSSGRLRLVLVVLIAGVVLMPLVLTGATYSSRGAVWQGRYGLALAVGVPLVASLAMSGWNLSRARLLVVAGGVLLATANAVGLVKVLLDERVRPESRSDPAWHVPSPLLAVIVVACAWLVYTYAVIGSSRTDE
jgi:hypothetical protein